MKRFTKRNIIFGPVALLLLCCLGVMVASFLSPDDPEGDATAVAEVREVAIEEMATPETEPTATARSTKTVVPSTSAPAIADTPAPTETPEPTATAVATETPDSGELTAEEQVYRDSVLEISDSYSQALTLFSEQMLAAGEDVTLLANEDWIIRTATALALLSVAGEEVRELEPSQRFGVLNDYLLEAAGHFDQVVILLPEGIDELDAEKMNQASEEMLLGQLAIENATAEIQRLVEEEGVRFSDR